MGRSGSEGKIHSAPVLQLRSAMIVAKVPSPIGSSDNFLQPLSVFRTFEPGQDILALVYFRLKDEVLVDVGINGQMWGIEGHQPVSKDANFQRPLVGPVLEKDM